MKFYLLLSITAIIALCCSTSSATDFEPGAIVVKLKPGLNVASSAQPADLGAASLNRKATRFQVERVEPHFQTRSHNDRTDLPDLSRIYRLHFPSDMDVHLLAHVFDSDPQVEYAEPIPIGYPDMVPNDTMYVQQQHLPQIMAPEAWDIHHGEDGAEPVLVAIVDSGVDYLHPDLVANIWTNPNEIPDNGLDDDQNGYIDDVRGWDFVDGDNDPMDGGSHGTFTSGIAAGVTDNVTGIASVSWNVQIMPVRGFMYQGIIYAAENGAHVISNSWGTATYSRSGQEAIDYATALGSIVVASAGNGDTSALHYPSAHAGVISVAAVDDDDQRTYYSHYGISIDISAPGGDGGLAPGLGILSTVPDSSYSRGDGTSASAPMVAGLLALVKSYHPEWSADQIATQVLASADPIDDLNPDYGGMLGSGRMNAYEALASDALPPDFPLKLMLFDVQAVDAQQDGGLDPGDTVTVSVMLQNFAHVGTDDYSATLSCDDPQITLLDQTFSGSIAADDFTVLEDAFQFTISPEATPHQVTFTLNSQADVPIQHGATLTLTVFVGTGTFRPVPNSPVVLDDNTSYGNNWIDYDNDRDDDLFVANGSSANHENSALYRNQTGAFVKITDGILVNDGGLSYCSTWADVDNNGWPDVFISNTTNTPNFLYLNDGGSFSKVTEGAVVTDASKSDGCAWADYNRDGWVDLFVANLSGQSNFIYQNNGDGTLSRRFDADALPMVADGGSSNGCAWGDYNGDGWPDLFVGNASNQNNQLYSNDGDGTFTRITAEAGLEDGGFTLGGSWGDFDNDGDFDLFVANGNDQDNFLYQNNGDSTFTRLDAALLYPMIADSSSSGGSAWGDYDNDGWLDLFVANRNSQNNLLYHNQGDGTFARVTDDVVANTHDFSVSSSWGDFDLDGDLDLFVANGGRNAFYENLGTDSHWFGVRCLATTSNRAAIGTQVFVKATIEGQSLWQMRELSSQTGYAAQNSLVAHFGLGAATIIDTLRIEWPSGTVDVFTNLTVDRYVLAGEGEDELSTDASERVVKTHPILRQNYPNPWFVSSHNSQSHTAIHFELPYASNVSIDIYNVAGQKVKTLTDRDFSAGLHQIQWDGRNDSDIPVGSGIYYYRMQTEEGFAAARRMILIR